jgi:hypothetical protein
MLGRVTPQNWQMITITKYNRCLIQWKPPDGIIVVHSQADHVKQMVTIPQSNFYSKLTNCDQDNLISLSE